MSLSPRTKELIDPSAHILLHEAMMATEDGKIQVQRVETSRRKYGWLSKGKPTAKKVVYNFLKFGLVNCYIFFFWGGFQNKCNSGYFNLFVFYEGNPFLTSTISPVFQCVGRAQILSKFPIH